MEKTYNLITERKEQLGALLSVVRDDLTMEEALKGKVEMIEILNADDLLEDVDIKCIGSLARFVCRAWLFEYKERGYILLDQGNGHYDYFCTAEDLFDDLGISNILYEISNF